LVSFFVGFPSNDGDLVVEYWLGKVLSIDCFTKVVIKLRGGLDTARDWTILQNLSLHCSLTSNTVVMGDVILLVVDSPAFVEAGLSCWTWWPCAVSADIDWLAAIWFDKVCSIVLFTRGVRDSCVEGVF